MAALQRLLSQTRRHSQLSPLPWLRRSLCSSPSPSQPDPNPNPNPIPSPNETRRQSVSVQAVSYPIKPKDPSPSQSSLQDPVNHERSDPNMQNPQQQRAWSREDVRFVKDFNPSSAVNRVAPLPEDKSQEDVERANEEMEAERRRIEADNRVMRRVFRVEEQQTVPFPTLLKAEQRQSTNQKVVHDLKEAVQLVKANAKRNFDETLEAHVKLAVDLRRTDLKLTGSLSLPHGSGKALRVAVFAEGAAADEARAAGADLVGGEDLIEGIKNGSINTKDIDKCIAMPQLMPRIGKEISKKLNRLTPNARDGSVTTDILRAVKEAKKNITFKKDKSAIVHVGLGKVSFTEEALCENVGAFVNALLLAKPAGLKKSSKYAGYVTTFHICSTMGPSFPVSIQSLSIAADRYTKLQMR
ncbi:putative ribosomal protein L1 [Helianthus debilis subsp. tardiflorus]